MKIVSWNVNGIIACRNHGFLKFLKKIDPDIVCCHENRGKAPQPCDCKMDTDALDVA